MGGARPPSGKGGDKGKESTGGLWGVFSKILDNVSVNVNVGSSAPRPRAPSGSPADPAARMEPVRQDRQETHDEMVYRTTDGTEGQAPMVRVDRDRQHIARNLDSRTKGADDQAEIPRGGGQPLSKDVRERMEPRLGADLSGVRIHTGGQSEEASQALNAKAFTVGSDVHFATGNYQPGSKEGDRLLAHELTHTVQAQRSGIHRKADEQGEADAGGEHGGANVSEPNEPAEKEADAVADHVADDLHSGGDAGDKHSGDHGAKKDGQKGHDQKNAHDAKGGKQAPGHGAHGDGGSKTDGGGADAKNAGSAGGGGLSNSSRAEGGPKGDAGGSPGGADKSSGESASAGKPDGGGAAKEKAPAIGAKLAVGAQSVGKKIYRLPGNQPRPGGAPNRPGQAPNAPAPTPPVTVSGAMKGQPHSLTADATAHTVKLDGADAVPAGQAAKAALPDPGDPRYAEANAQIDAINGKLQQLAGRVAAGTPPTTAELRQLSQETMRAMQAFGDRFDVKRLGDPLPEFPSPIVGPHPLSGAKPPDNSSRNSHHVPPKELAQSIATEAEQTANQMLGGPNAIELTPAAQRIIQAVGQIRANGNGNGLTAILIHQLTHQAAGGAAVHSATMKAQILAGLTRICDETQRERILIMNNAKAGLPQGLSVNPNATQFAPFMQQCRTQATQIRDERRKQQAEQKLQQAEAQEQQLTSRAQTREANEGMQLLHQQAQIAFQNAFGQAKVALRAALMASHVDGPVAGRQGALGQIDGQAPQTWAPILNAGG